ncbi:MAG: HNH endonuclease [Myxococcales bacterium]|nr:HNH endonuclease [Myxococcales bacterium]
MGRREHEFQEADKNRVLLWCARHCCLCGKFAGLGIEIAHIDPQKSDIDNAMPLCFDCHAAIGHYNASHPRGRKYSIPELKARRDQVYDEHTQHLIAPVPYRVFQDGVKLPKVPFAIENHGMTYPLQARVIINLRQGDAALGCPPTAGHYNGLYLWNLNPRQAVRGNFEMPYGFDEKSSAKLVARVEITLIDTYKREHNLLPGGYILDRGQAGDWYFEPCEEQLGAKGEHP